MEILQAYNSHFASNPEGDEMKDVWVAIDTNTHRIIDFGGQSAVQSSANEHQKLSGNKTILRTLKVGMILGDYI